MSVPPFRWKRHGRSLWLKAVNGHGLIWRANCDPIVGKIVWLWQVGHEGAERGWELTLSKAKDTAERAARSWGLKPKTEGKRKAANG